MGPCAVNGKALLDTCFALESAIGYLACVYFWMKQTFWSRKHESGNVRIKGVFSEINTLAAYQGESFLHLLHPKCFCLLVCLK